MGRRRVSLVNVPNPPRVVARMGHQMIDAIGQTRVPLTHIARQQARKRQRLDQRCLHLPVCKEQATFQKFDNGKDVCLREIFQHGCRTASAIHSAHPAVTTQSWAIATFTIFALVRADGASGALATSQIALESDVTGRKPRAQTLLILWIRPQRPRRHCSMPHMRTPPQAGQCLAAANFVSSIECCAAHRACHQRAPTIGLTIRGLNPVHLYEENGRAVVLCQDERRIRHLCRFHALVTSSPHASHRRRDS